MGYTAHFIKRLVAGIVKHNIGALGAIISFFGFSAMIPFLLLMVYGASMFIPHSAIQHFLSYVLSSYVPTIPDTKLYLTQNVSRLVALDPDVGLVGLIGLLWSTVGGFVSFQQILDVIWEAHHRRPFLKQYLVGFGMLGILLLLTVLSSLATVISPLLIRATYSVSWMVVVHGISLSTFPLLLFLTCYFCYRFLPSYRLRNLYLLIGSLVATVAIYVSRDLFVWFIGNIGRYEMIYGTLTFIMLFTFWLYVVSVIILFGAEVAMALHTTLGSPGTRHDQKTTIAPNFTVHRQRSRI